MIPPEILHLHSLKELSVVFSDMRTLEDQPRHVRVHPPRRSCTARWPPMQTKKLLGWMSWSAVAL